MTSPASSLGSAIESIPGAAGTPASALTRSQIANFCNELTTDFALKDLTRAYLEAVLQELSRAGFDVAPYTYKFEKFFVPTSLTLCESCCITDPATALRFCVAVELEVSREEESLGRCVLMAHAYPGMEASSDFRTILIGVPGFVAPNPPTSLTLPKRKDFVDESLHATTESLRDAASYVLRAREYVSGLGRLLAP